MDRPRSNAANFIKPVDFLVPYVHLNRLKSSLAALARLSTSNGLKTLPRKLIRRSKQTESSRKSILKPGDGRKEIKLDELRAGEIEALITRLANDQYVSQDEDSGIRKSTRPKRPRIIRNYGELNSEDEEIIRTGVVRAEGSSKTKGKMGSEDEDYFDSTCRKRQKSKRQHFNREPNVTSDEDTSPSVSETTVRKGPRVAGVLKKPPSKYTCRMCDIIYSYQMDYLDHMKDNHRKDDKYLCFCQDIFDTLYQLTTHLKKHKNPRSLLNRPKPGEGSERPGVKCSICAKEFMYKSLLALHMKHHDRVAASASKNPHECPICHRRFPAKFRLQNHFIIHLDNNPFKCEFPSCGKAFRNKYSLERHVALHTQRRVFYKCTKCPAEFTCDSRLKIHMNKYHSEGSTLKLKIRKKFLLVQSVFDSASSAISNNHNKSNKDDNGSDERFELESIHLADRIIVQEDKTDVHVKGETLSPIKSKANQGRSRSCSPTCLSDEEDGSQSDGAQNESEKSLDFRSLVLSDPALKRLKKDNPEAVNFLLTRFSNTTHHRLKKFKCEKCPWASNMAFALKKHMKWEHGEKALQLDQGPSANASTNLDTASGSCPDLTLTCGTCGHQSKSSEDLSSHIDIVHIRENKFTCLTCGYRCKDKVRLDKHKKRVHEKEKKFSCPKCPAKYLRKFMLATHMKEKHDLIYMKKLKEACTCKVCGRVLINRKSYNNHMKLHSDREPTLCKICGQACVNIYTLRKHIQYVHLGVKNKYNEIARERRQQAQNKTKGSNSANSDGNQGANKEPISLTNGSEESEKDAETDNRESVEIIGF